MKTKVVVGGPKDIPTQFMAVGLFEGESTLAGPLAELNDALGGLIARLIVDREITGKLNEVVVLHPQSDVPTRRVAVVGLGKRDDLTLDRVRQAAGSAAKKAQGLKLERFASTLLGEGAGGLSAEALGQAMVEGAALATYQYNAFKSNKDDFAPAMEELTIVTGDQGVASAVEAGALRGLVTAAATVKARDLANGPGNLITPTYLKEEAQKLANEFGLQLDVLDEAQMRHLGMGAFLGVAEGSDEPGYMIILRYNGAGEGKPTLALVGKAITFDSGGISIKPSEGMQDMKFDMSGGAAVLGAMQGLATLKAPVNVLGIVAATENLPSGRALKPGDIVTASNGKTIEILSTDAEGRLVLSDALAYAVKIGADAIIDIATLTGACIVALGHFTAGLMGNNDDLLAMVEKAGESSGERVWRLPLWPQYKDLIKSDVADIKNTGGRYGGAITGGAFIGVFADDKPWAHIDMAGMSDTDKPGPYTPKGGTGYGARLFIDLAIAWGQAHQ